MYSKRAKALLGTAALATAALFSFAPQTAIAKARAMDAICQPNHCYGITEYHEAAFNATGQELWTDCLVHEEAGGFASHEMWLPFPNNKWIEAGYIKGPIAGGDPNSHFRFFWAEYNGTTLSTHFIQNAPILTYTNLSWYRAAGTGYWSIYLNGTLKGTTTSPYPNGLVVQTGGETTFAGVKSHGKSRYLMTRTNSTGAWTLASVDFVKAKVGVYQVNNNAWERMEQISLQQICDPLPGGPPGTFRAANADDSRLKSLALSMARDSGESNPTNLEVVDTTRAKANAVQIDTNPGVYTVQMRGNFSARGISRPHGAKAPTGDFMTVTIDKATGQVTDYTLGKERKDLSRLGAVRVLR